MGYLIINTKDSDEYRKEMRQKMSQNFRNGQMRNSASFKSEEEAKKVYCEGYEHGYEDAMKEIQGGDEFKSSEFRYGNR